MSHNITVQGGTTVRLPTAGKYCDRDIIVTAEGGSIDLNVVTAASLPSTVVDGQIVVITDTAAGTVYIDTDEPANPASGDVWVKVASGGIALELTEESPYLRNSMTGTVQWDGSSWQKRDGFLGASGEWIPMVDPKALPSFSYSGEYAVNETGEGWEISFLSSGRLQVTDNAKIDVFLVGGGGGGGGGSHLSGTGGNSSGAYAGGGGGGGGYTSTYTGVQIIGGEEYTIEVGSGGTGGKSATAGTGGYGGTGGTSTAFGYEALGGNGGATGRPSGGAGGSGGSGGGGGLYNTSSGSPAGGPAGNGGKDGEDGQKGTPVLSGTSTRAVGVGQGSTTRSFGDADGTLYSGGGGAGCPYKNDSSTAGKGGEGGGGTGGGYVNGVWTTTAEAGLPNTGGGGGGGCCETYAASFAGGAGGSGIVIIRNARG